MTHVKTVAAYEGFVRSCSGLGDKYNPGSPKLQLEALNVLLVNATESLAKVKAAKTEYDNLTNDREVMFRDLPKLAASVILTLSASGASDETLNDARVFFRLINGRRATDRPPVASADEELKKRPKFGQRSYVSLADHFSRLVQAATVDPNYMANEPHLSKEGLKSILEKMNGLNSEVAQVKVTLSNARIARNEILYTSPSSVYEVFRLGKKYVRAIFGLNSEQYRQMKSNSISKPQIG